MSVSLQRALTSAVLRILRPLVRILLRNGVSYLAFADLAKWVYVDVAWREFAIPGRKPSVSRAAVLTGLSRKEVSRVIDLPVPNDEAMAAHYHRAARVVRAWVGEPDYQTDGQPAELFAEGEEPSFHSLVKRFSGDMPSRAVLDELLRVGAVEMTSVGRIRLKTRAYIPHTGDASKLHILGTDVFDLISTIDFNLQNGAAPRFQRKLSYDNLPEEILPVLHRLAGEKAQRLLEEMDGWLGRYDRDINPAAGGRGRKRAGLGIYYFEANVPEENKP